jgi:hypothetical protein
MNFATTNLFPPPYWAPALQRVPTPLQVLNEAFANGERRGFVEVSPIAKTRGKMREMARRKAQALWSLWSCQFGV